MYKQPSILATPRIEVEDIVNSSSLSSSSVYLKQHTQSRTNKNTQTFISVSVLAKVGIR